LCAHFGAVELFLKLMTGIVADRLGLAQLKERAPLQRIGRLSPSKILSMRYGKLTWRRMAVAAAASGGATMAPSATAACREPAHAPPLATTAVVKPTATTTNVETDNQLLRKSHSEASKAASSSTGATNSASAGFGSSVHEGLAGKNANSALPIARKVGGRTLT
jgi:hypothetical protein